MHGAVFLVGMRVILVGEGLELGRVGILVRYGIC